MPNLDISRAERLDQRVVSLMPVLSRAFAVQLINEGNVTVDGKVVTKAGTKIQPFDDVVLNYELKEFTVPDIELPILYEDDDCVVVVKPIGLLTHSKGVFNPEPSVATWLHNRIVDETLLDADKDSLNSRAGIVHRLDRATSGVMICAKTPTALSWLQKQFAERNVKKTYMAVIQGTLDPSEAIIDMPIERNPKAPATFRVGVRGKQAKTTYKVLRSNGTYSLVRLRPETGRTHQLRVHLAYQKHPIVGDTLYRGESAERLYLHAAELEITIHAGHERKVFQAPLPSEFETKVQ